MTYELILGDRTYSSWSLRGWLLFAKFGLEAKTRFVSFLEERDFSEKVGLPPANTVPVLVTPEGAVVHDSLAIAEELATRHPDAGLWPADPKLRATARTLAAEMHSSFSTLRGDCPMNLRTAYETMPVSDALRADLARLELIWAHALALSGGPWLCGDYSVADVFFAPVAARIAGYALPVSEAPQTYVAQHLADPALRRWRACGLVNDPELPWYARDYPQTSWPGPAPLVARAVDKGPSENTACPYSGDPVTHFLEIDGRVFGFCNSFCRDKTVNDPEAWPAFMAIYQS